MENKTQISQFFSKRRVYLAIFICLSIVGVIYFLEWRKGSQNLMTLHWTGMSAFYLLLGLCFMALRDLAYMWRIRILTDKQLSWKQSFQVIMLWEFASAVSPGVVGGSAVAFFILEKEKIPLGKSTALVIITLILDNLFYVLLIPTVLFFIDVQALFPVQLSAMAKSGMGVFWIGYGIIVGITLVLIAGVFISPKIIYFFVKLIYKLPYLRRRAEKADQFAMDIETASVALKNKRFLYWIKLILATMGAWFSRFLVVNCVLFAFIGLNFWDNFIILGRQLIMWLAMLVTPTPGGSGMAEYAFSELFADYVLGAGVSAVSLALIWRTLSYYPYLLIGSIVLPRWLRKP